ncbi:hypothetical protein [Phaeobacter sp. HF9A]|uniref:hypothetical protein n=1 Tax=Phaeobacter sp. HF9A TaxID=2721561 RepID=UPI001431C60F|nr:hypothetical protein [Phaeobacter sp. HF9A]NIZ13425.1 hypothetical protein [Phaeobacter sp. HF9A]
MLPAMRPYSGVPAAASNIAVLSQTETVSVSRGAGDSAGAEFANSRLANFLSDDPAPRDRDLDTLMSGNPGDKYNEGPRAPANDNSSRAELAPPPPPETMDPISRASMENVLTSQMKQADALADDQIFRGSSPGSYAQEMYTNTRDVLTRIAA